MSGRYAFSLPEPRQRDGWFRIGNIDVTTTVFVVLLGLASMVLYAISPNLLAKGVFETSLVRDGEVWRVATWSAVNPPIDVWMLINLAFFWFVGHIVEDDLGRKPMAVLLAAMTIIPAVIVTIFNVVNDDINPRWEAGSFSVRLLLLGLITIWGLDNPNAKVFFGIPAWVISAAYVFIEVLRDVGNRAWAELLLVLLVVVVGCLGAAQRGMLDVFPWIPRSKRLAGPAPSPYGELRSNPPKSKRFGFGRKAKGKGGSGSGSTVVSGPWAQPPSGGPTPLEQAELDVLLDKISASGIDSLTRQEKDRLTALSKRMRGS